MHQRKKLNGIKVGKLSIFFVFLGSICTVMLFLSTLKIRKQHENAVEASRDYLESSKSVYDFLNTVEKLSTYSSLFIMNYDLSQLQLYVSEIEHVKSRENCIDILELTHIDDYSDSSLKKAYEQSNVLCNYEMYIMKLVCEGLSLKDELIPKVISAITLSQEDLKLSNQEKIVKARNLYFSDSYLLQKDKISFFANSALHSLVNENLAIQKESEENIQKTLVFQFSNIFILFCISVILTIISNMMILLPLLKNVEALKKEEKMKISGAYEIRYIAEVYNSLFEKNAIVASDLKHKAEHDPLTGLINRNGFDKIKSVLKDTNEEIAYLLIDIDFFKKINDENGHLVGDKVLKKIADLLSVQFRATDYVARIGGDEFAIIMTKIGTVPEKVIQRKIEEINKTLQTIEDGLPPVSLSVGVSFSKNGFTPEMIENADKALYKVKKGGRCNCSFFEEFSID